MLRVRLELPMEDNDGNKAVFSKQVCLPVVFEGMILRGLLGLQNREFTVEDVVVEPDNHEALIRLRGGDHDGSFIGVLSSEFEGWSMVCFRPMEPEGT